VKLVEVEGLTAGQAARRQSVPNASLGNWVRAARAGKLAEVGKGRQLPSELELELARTDISELLRWQWAGYAKYHQSRANLLIHIIAVPLFLIGTIALVVALSQFSLTFLAVGVGCIVVSVALQGRGHRLEVVPPEPFSGPLNFVSRLFFEQWVTFPRFVISGGWGAALRKVREP
jgi:hypothetical protein